MSDDPDTTVTIKQHLKEIVDLHMIYIRNDLTEIKGDIKALQSTGCAKGATNAARLDALNVSSMKAGGITGAIASAFVLVVNYLMSKAGL